MRRWLLFLLFAQGPLIGMAGGVQIQVNAPPPPPPPGYYYSDGYWYGPWYGPGWYWGVYIDNEAEYRYYYEQRRWHHHGWHHYHYDHHH